MVFDLDYLVDNGKRAGWLTDYEPGCKLVQWLDDNSYSVLDASGKPLGWGDTADDAFQDARCILTNRRRECDGVIPFKFV